MSKSCFYCEGTRSKKLSQEHLISRVVLETVFGKPIRNIARAELLGDKSLIDHEQTLKDVCIKCNTDLSPYDMAGSHFVRDIDQFYDTTSKRIIFSEDILAWLIKTHINHIRLIRDAETNEIYPIDKQIKGALLDRQPVDPRLYRLFIEGWEGKEYFWTPDHPKRITYFSYRSIRFRSQCMVLSDFRIKALDTIMLLPSDGKYNGYEERVESVLNEIKDTWSYSFQPIYAEENIRSGYLQIEKVLPFSRIQSFLRPSK